MSRTGSILEAYWNNNHHPKTAHVGKIESFDLESTDELGIHGNKSSSQLVLTNKSSQKTSPATSILFPKTNPDSNNTMNGLFCM
jgi:hypothetical protein